MKSTLPIDTLGIMISNKCNINCRSCYNTSQRKRPIEADLQTGKKIIDYFSEWENIKHVGYTGGEPFINYDIVLGLIEYSQKKYGYYSTINTNGSWGQSYQKAYDLLSELKTAGLKVLGLSVDSFHQEFVAFECITNVINASYDLGIEVYLQTIYGKDTWKSSDIKNMLGPVQNKITDYIQGPITLIGNPENKLNYNELPWVEGIQNECSMLKVVLCNIEGDIRLCCGAVPLDDKFILAGNIFNDSLAEIIHNAENNPLFNSLFLYRGPRNLAEISDGCFNSDFSMRSYTSTCHSCLTILNSDYYGRISEKLDQYQQQYLIMRHFVQKELEEIHKTKGGVFYEKRI